MIKKKEVKKVKLEAKKELPVVKEIPVVKKETHVAPVAPVVKAIEIKPVEPKAKKGKEYKVVNGGLNTESLNAHALDGWHFVFYDSANERAVFVKE